MMTSGYRLRMFGKKQTTQMMLMMLLLRRKKFKLENLIIIWKKGTKIVTLGDKPYEDDDKRIQVENVWKETNNTDDADDDATENKKVQLGNNLVIRLSEENDAGDYTCQVSSANVLELKHSVKIIA